MNMKGEGKIFQRGEVQGRLTGKEKGRECARGGSLGKTNREGEGKRMC